MMVRRYCRSAKRADGKRQYTCAEGKETRRQIRRDIGLRKQTSYTILTLFFALPILTLSSVFVSSEGATGVKGVA